MALIYVSKLTKSFHLFSGPRNVDKSDRPMSNVS